MKGDPDHPRPAHSWQLDRAQLDTVDGGPEVLPSAPPRAAVLPLQLPRAAVLPLQLPRAAVLPPEQPRLQAPTVQPEAVYVATLQHSFYSGIFKL